MQKHLFVFLFALISMGAQGQFYLGVGGGVTSAKPDPNWGFANTSFVPTFQCDYNLSFDKEHSLRFGLGAYYRHGDYSSTSIHYSSSDSSSFTSYVSKGEVQAIPLRLMVSHYINFDPFSFFYGFGLEGDLYRRVNITHYAWLSYGQIAQSDVDYAKYYFGSRAESLAEAIWFKTGFNREIGKRFFVEGELSFNMPFLQKKNNSYYNNDFSYAAMLRLGIRLGNLKALTKNDSIPHKEWPQKIFNGAISSGKSSIISVSTLDPFAGIYAIGWEQQINRNFSVLARAGLTRSEVNGLPWIDNTHSGDNKYVGYFHWSSGTKTLARYGFAVSAAFRYYPLQSLNSPGGLHLDAAVGYRKFNYALVGVDANEEVRLEERASYQDNLSFGGQFGYQMVIKRISFDLVIGWNYAISKEIILYSMQHWYDGDWHFYWDESNMRYASPQGYLGIHLGYQLIK